MIRRPPRSPPFPCPPLFRSSVRAGLAALPRETAIVLVHDAARPFVSRGTIEAVIARARAGVGAVAAVPTSDTRSEEHTSELQSQSNLVCRLLLEKKNRRVSL